MSERRHSGADCMSTAESYRRKTFELAACINADQNPELKRSWETMVRGYRAVIEHEDGMAHDPWAAKGGSPGPKWRPSRVATRRGWYRPLTRRLTGLPSASSR